MSKFNILVLGHFGGHNTGDEAMLYGMLTNLNSNSDFVIDLVSKGNESDYYFNFPFSIVKPGVKPILSSLVKSDLIILCGGTHFHDDYVFSRYLRHVRYLSRYLVIFGLARILGKKVALLANGLGPFKFDFTKFLTRMAIGLSNLITVRDKASYDEIQNIGMLSKKTFLTFDLAALLPLKETTINRNFIGVSLTPLHYYNDNGDDLNTIYFEQVAEGLEQALSKNSELSVKIFIIRGGERESDVAISKDLYFRLSGKFGMDRVFLSDFNFNPITTLNEIAECKGGFIASRYHSAMLGYISNLPLLFLAYHRKLEDLAFDVKLDPDSCIPLTFDNLKSNMIEDRIFDLSKGNKRYLAKVEPELMVQKAMDNIHLLNDLLSRPNI